MAGTCRTDARGGRELWCNTQASEPWTAVGLGPNNRAPTQNDAIKMENIIGNTTGTKGSKGEEVFQPVATPRGELNWGGRALGTEAPNVQGVSQTNCQENIQPSDPWDIPRGRRAEPRTHAHGGGKIPVE